MGWVRFRRQCREMSEQSTRSSVWFSRGNEKRLKATESDGSPLMDSGLGEIPAPMSRNERTEYQVICLVFHKHQTANRVTGPLKPAPRRKFSPQRLGDAEEGEQGARSSVDTRPTRSFPGPDATPAPAQGLGFLPTPWDDAPQHPTSCAPKGHRGPHRSRTRGSVRWPLPRAGSPGLSGQPPVPPHPLRIFAAFAWGSIEGLGGRTTNRVPGHQFGGIRDLPATGADAPDFSFLG